jgi:hypothetical protein
MTASFRFGMVGTLNSKISVYCLLLVVGTIVFFDHMRGILEYFLQSSKLYNQMIRTIYKELMLMGLVSFAIAMYETSETAHVSASHDWIVGVDFAHILLFFLTFFLVAHAFYLMRESIVCSQYYVKNYFHDITLLVHDIKKTKEKFLSRFLYHLNFLPLSSVRDKAEFLLIHSLFQQTYLFPVDFNFPSYLKGCFIRHSLKIINRSLLTWFILILLILANYTRLKTTGFQCSHQYLTPESASHRGLSGEVKHDDDYTSTEDRNHFAYHCNLHNLILFVLLGVSLCVYTIVLVNISRLYKIRLDF